MGDKLLKQLVEALEADHSGQFIIDLGEALTISARGGYVAQADSVDWLSAHNEILHRLLPFLKERLSGSRAWPSDSLARTILTEGGYGTDESRQSVRFAVENALRYRNPESS